MTKKQILKYDHLLLQPPPSREEIAIHTQIQFENAAWHDFRVGLRGLTTEEKLKRLTYWWHSRVGEEERKRRVQVHNYINALKRGGLLK